jgi:peptidyl-prolyl cis-trans isomerase D
MLEFFRSHTKLLQLVLVLLIFPSFVFFGLQGYSKFNEGDVTTVAKVDGQKITQAQWDAAHRQQIDRIRQQMPNVDPALLDTPAMKQRTLDALIRERVLIAAARKEHLYVSDEHLARVFQTDPQFAGLRRPDGSINKELLAAQGMSSEAFAEQLRQELSTRQVLQSVEGAQAVAASALDRALAALLERREIQVQRFDTKDYLSKVAPTDAEVDAYYKAHSDQFRAPEEAQIQYAVLDLDALKQQIKVSDNDLHSYYDQNKSRFTTAEERRASHILIAVDKSASADVRAKAKAKAEALLAEVRKNPDSFADVAKKESQDPGSAAQGGDLDFFGRGAMTKPFEDAVFSMKEGEISDVIATDFGYHIIKLTGIRGGTTKPFDAVRGEIEDEVGKQLARKRFADAAEQFTNLVYEQADSLQPAVDKLKLKLETATVQRKPAQGATGVLTSPKLLDAIFSADVLRNKHNTEAIETAPDQMASARVVKYAPAHTLPLAEVRDRVLDKLRSQQAADAARKDGEAKVAELKKDPAAALAQTVTVSRAQTQGQPRNLVDAALRADLSKGAVALGVDLGADGYAALKVDKVVPRESSDPDNAQGRNFVAQALTAAESAAFYDTLKQQFNVKIEAPAPAAAASAAADSP